MAGDDDIKVSCCYLPVRGRNNGLLTINYTMLYGLINPENILATISRIVADLETRLENISSLDIRFSVSGNYYLQNTLTSELRLFYGNFAINEANLVLLQQFIDYRGENHLVQTVREATSQDNIQNILVKPFYSSNWQFSYFRDITISFQVKTNVGDLNINKQCYKKPVNDLI